MHYILIIRKKYFFKTKISGNTSCSKTTDDVKYLGDCLNI